MVEGAGTQLHLSSFWWLFLKWYKTHGNHGDCGFKDRESLISYTRSYLLDKLELHCWHHHNLHHCTCTWYQVLLLLRRAIHGCWLVIPNHFASSQRSLWKTCLPKMSCKWRNFPIQVLIIFIDPLSDSGWYVDMVGAGCCYIDKEGAPYTSLSMGGRAKDCEMFRIPLFW